MIHTGMGPTHVNNFLTECNIPPISENTLRKKEKEINKAIHDFAMTSCREAQLQEILLSHDKVCYFYEDVCTNAYIYIYNVFFALMKNAHHTACFA